MSDLRSIDRTSSGKYNNGGFGDGPKTNEYVKFGHISEAGENPVLCLSNRDINERAREDRKSLERKLWEGASVGYKDSVGRPVRLVELVF